VQQAQQYYRKLSVAILIVVTVVMAAATSSFAGITGHPAPDPLLDGAVRGPCDPELDGPNYVPDVDVSGQPVIQADVPVARQPVPAEVLVPLGRGGRRSGQGPVASLDGKQLDPILNPKSACPPGAR
jgi:hypothetical protein